MTDAVQSGPTTRDTTLDPAEVQRFARMAAEWWDPKGKFRPLHQIGPARLSFIRDKAVARTLNEHLGQRVVLHYTEHRGVPTTCFGTTDYYVDSVRAIP